MKWASPHNCDPRSYSKNEAKIPSDTGMNGEQTSYVILLRTSEGQMNNIYFINDWIETITICRYE